MSEFSKEKLIFHLERALKLPCRKIHYVGICQDYGGNAGKEAPFPRARFFYCISGTLHLRCSTHAGGKEFFLAPGEAVFAPPHNIIKEQWDHEMEMLSVIFSLDYQRLVYIQHDGFSPPPAPAPNPTLYYFLPQAFNPVAQSTLRALVRAARLTTNQRSFPGGEHLLNALMENILQDCSASTPLEIPQKQFLWNEILDYTASRINRPELTREEVAERFHLHRAHISRLFLQQLGIGFMDFVMNERFQIALDLLAIPSLNIDEIAQSCGFRYTSYFIRAFRKRFKMSPGAFRETLSFREKL